MTILWSDVDNLVGGPKSQSPVQQTGPLSRLLVKKGKKRRREVNKMFYLYRERYEYLQERIREAIFMDTMPSPTQINTFFVTEDCPKTPNHCD